MFCGPKTTLETLRTLEISSRTLRLIPVQVAVYRGVDIEIHLGFREGAINGGKIPIHNQISQQVEKSQRT